MFSFSRKYEKGQHSGLSCLPVNYQLLNY